MTKMKQNEKEMKAIRAGMRYLSARNVSYTPLRWDYGKGSKVPCEYVAKKCGFDSCEHMYEFLVRGVGTGAKNEPVAEPAPEYGAGGHFKEEKYEFKEETALVEPGKLGGLMLLMGALVVLWYLLFVSIRRG